ncbi:hypothetical protein D3871_27755 [Noviherbaspirillum saxi]|uniref:NodB homology domain-containing protein n=2 Tax=Noviherbaspirillum saxi TaxID=2320863 RepID=A0A3A3FM44_9BURK|nr:hypothetical protein D3871_27755 [Noviherbaspirillum saxi]
MMVILGVGVPVLMYLTVMQSLGWRVPLITMNGAISFVASSSENVILYASPSTKAYFGTIGGNYDTLLVPWRDYFANRKRTYKEVREPGQLKEFKNGVLVLPSAIALSDEERAEILSFRQKGGSVLATWATGSRNGKGDWAGWEFLETLGVKMTGEIPRAAEVSYLIVNGESPVTYKHPAGQRLPLSKTSETLLRAKGEMVAGRFMNWARIVEPERRDEGAIVYTETAPGPSRTTFYAFAESVWESRPLMMYEVIDNTLQWLQREPAIVRAAWPNGKRAAQVIEMDTEDGFPNAEVFASMMRAIDYRATFYVLTSVGRRYPEVLTRLHRDFEVGYHADVHDGFKGQPPKLQEQRMQIMRTEMATVIPDVDTITGFRAPLEGYDAATEALLHKSGIRHHAADPSRTEARLPIVSKLPDVEPDDALIVLPRTQRDDINLASQNLNVEQTTKELIEDFDLAVDQGALGLLSVHSQNFHADSVLAKAMPGYLERLKQRKDQLWLASAGQVADWWREREHLRVSTVSSGKRLELDITVVGKKRLNGASVIVMLPQKGPPPTVQPVKTGLAKPTVVKLDEYRAAIMFGALEPGDYAYQVTF